MEISTKMGEDSTLEMEICRETCQEEFRSETIPFRTEQIEMQYQQNILPEEQPEIQEEVVDKLNLKHQIDIQKLVLEESKQYINIEERSKILESAMEQQITKAQEYIQLLKQKIKKEMNIQRRAEMEMNKENRKLLEIKNFTESTKEIVDILKSYVEGFEQQMKKLKFAELQKNVFKKYEESCQTIRENTNVTEKLNNELKTIGGKNKVCREKLKHEFESAYKNLKAEEERLREKLDALLQRNHQLNDENTRIDHDLNHKQNDEVEKSRKLKEFLDSKINELEKYKLDSSRIQAVEFERNNLQKRVEYLSSSIEMSTEDVEKLIQENSTIEAQLKISHEVGDNSEDVAVEMLITDREKEHQRLGEELRNIEKQLRQYHDELLIKNHEKEMALLKNQSILNCRQNELLVCQNSNGEYENVIQKLVLDVEELERGVGEKQEMVETVEKELNSLGTSKEQHRNSLETLQKEIKDNTDQLHYKKNTLKVHLENKLRDLENKLEGIKKMKEEEKEKFTKIEAFNKKKNEQYNRLRNVYLMLKTSSEFKSPESMRSQSTIDNRQKDKDQIEPEDTDTSPKGILKSPGTSKTPTTPTKNVKFVGVPSIASSNSSEMVNANTIEKPDGFDELNNSFVQRKRKRTFD